MRAESIDKNETYRHRKVRHGADGVDLDDGVELQRRARRALELLHGKTNEEMKTKKIDCGVDVAQQQKVHDDEGKNKPTRRVLLGTC